MTGAEIAVVLGASLLGAFVKAVTGMGYPVIAIPLITLVLGIEDAVVIVAAPNLAANLILCWGARAGRAESRDLPLLVGWGANPERLELVLELLATSSPAGPEVRKKS